MSDVAAAEIPVEINTPVNPVSAQMTPEQPQEPEKGAEKPEAKPERKETAKDSVMRAAEKVKAKAEAENAAKPADDKPKAQPKQPVPKAEAKPTEQPAEQQKPAEAKPEVPQGERKQWHEAPRRYSAEAKQAWESTPDQVKAETHRALSELERGLNQYREAYKDVEDYDRQARQSGTTIRQALDNYVGIERLLTQDPVAGFERIIANLGLKTNDGRPMTLHDFAAKVLDQEPNEQISRQTGVISQLQAKISQLEQQVSGVSNSIQQQRADAVARQVAEIAGKNPRFEELSEDIAMFIQTGRAKDLPEAISLAERLNPAPAPVQAKPETPKPLNPAGQKSVTGTPPGGSQQYPNKLPPSKTAREALERAARRLAG